MDLIKWTKKNETNAKKILKFDDENNENKIRKNNKHIHKAADKEKQPNKSMIPSLRHHNVG